MSKPISFRPDGARRVRQRRSPGLRGLPAGPGHRPNVRTDGRRPATRGGRVVRESRLAPEVQTTDMRVSLITMPEDTLTFAWMGRRARGELAILAVYLMPSGEFVAVSTRDGVSLEHSSRGCFQKLLDAEIVRLRGGGPPDASRRPR